MAIIYSPMAETLLENTSMKLGVDSVTGQPKKYEITPNEGYVLHDNRYDTPVFDENGNETGDVILGYRTSSASCSIAQFNSNYYEFYAVPIDDVPADQIFGTGNNHEIMSEPNTEVTE
jgi:hypothetical protein